MRIISGLRRGMKLLPPKGLQTTRPITDRVKESIFDVLYKYDLIEERMVADLFCGTGSFGLEAISRGAKGAVFVDADRNTVNILKNNIAKARFTAQSHVCFSNAFIVGAPNRSGEKFSLIFVDPPYAMSRQADSDSRVGLLMKLLSGQLADDGIVVIRVEKQINLLDSYGNLSIIDSRIWGSMKVGFFGYDKFAGGNKGSSHAQE